MLDTIGVDHFAGLLWPRIVGTRNGAPFRYTAELPKLVKDLLPNCPSVVCLYKLPWKVATGMATAQGNGPGFSHNGTQLYAYDFKMRKGADDLRDARRRRRRSRRVEHEELQPVHRQQRQRHQGRRGGQEGGRPYQLRPHRPRRRHLLLLRARPAEQRRTREGLDRSARRPDRLCRQHRPRLWGAPPLPGRDRQDEHGLRTDDADLLRGMDADSACGRLLPLLQARHERRDVVDERMRRLRHLSPSLALSLLAL